MEDIESTVRAYSDMLFRLCYAILRDTPDAEDAVSDVIVRYITTDKKFVDDEHKKAWLIRVATNVCYDLLRFNKRRNYVNLDEITEYCKTDESISVMTELMSLPIKYRTVIYLYYIEGYKTAEIARIISVSPSAVRKRLQYGRERLRLEFREEEQV